MHENEDDGHERTYVQYNTVQYALHNFGQKGRTFFGCWPDPGLGISSIACYLYFFSKENFLGASQT